MGHAVRCEAAKKRKRKKKVLFFLWNVQIVDLMGSDGPTKKLLMIIFNIDVLSMLFGFMWVVGSSRNILDGTAVGATSRG